MGRKKGILPICYHLPLSCKREIQRVIPASLKSILFILSFLTGSFSFAQVIQEPLPATKQVKQPSKKTATVFRTKSETKTIYLPFWDDFSTIPDSLDHLMFDTLHWMHSGSVTISKGAGVNAPSLNVATFNGLDSTNAPYRQEPLAKGFADKLISLPIDMSENHVSLSDRDSVFFSFFYQWKGNQEPPDDSDFLRLEFKNAQGQWIAVETIYGSQDLNSDEFYTKMIKITDPTFFHNAFQFRFRNSGRLSGPYDAWNVDYVYLNKSRQEEEIYFPDQAFMHPPTPILGRYRAMPLRQFKTYQTLRAPVYKIRNLNDDFDVLLVDVAGRFENYMDTTNVPTVTTIELGTDTLGIINPSQVRTDTSKVQLDTDDPLQFHPNALAIDLTLSYKARTSDVYNEEGDIAADYQARLAEFQFKVDFRVNDSISSTYRLRDYLAYDDGIAEYSIRLGQPGNRAAMRFELPIETDTLTGFHMYFPHYAGPNTQTVDFYIYRDKDGRPDDTPVRTLFTRTVNKNNANQFSLVDMKYDPLIVGNVFYIAWKEPSSTERLHVGLDKSQNTSDQLFQNYNGTWLPVNEVSGTAMIRPVFGSGGNNLPPVAVDEERSESTFLHPNPNDGTFYIGKDADVIEVLDLAGKQISYQSEFLETENKIFLSNISSGVYIVRWKAHGKIRYRKVMIVK